VFAVIQPRAGAERIGEVGGDDTWAYLLEDVATMQSLAHERLLPGSEDPGVVRQRSRGKLTCRERIDLLLDDGTFREVGSVAGFASYDEDGNVTAFTPANHVGGSGRIEGRSVVVCADDFTSRGGHSDGAIGAKSGYIDRLSIEMRIPSIRLLDGSSGGGSVAFFARVSGLELARRRDLLPDENRRADEIYYKVQFRGFVQKEPPTRNLPARPISFIRTTWDRFISAETVSDLYLKSDFYVDRVYHALRN